MPRRVGRFLVLSVGDGQFSKAKVAENKKASGKATPPAPAAPDGKEKDEKSPPRAHKTPAIKREKSEFTDQDKQEMTKLASLLGGRHTDLLPDLVPSKAIRLRDKVGEGAFGAVWRGVLYGQAIAVKTLKQFNVAEILAEVRVMQTLRHPNIVEYLGVTCGAACSSDRTIAIVSEFMEGGPLSRLLENERKAGRKFRLRRLLTMLKDVTRGLSWLHYRRIIHRDLKPSNILLDRYGRCKICDFGLAHCKETHREGGHYGVCGTLSYAAPEVLDEQEYGYKADVFSLAIVASEVIEGEYPIKLENIGLDRKAAGLRKDFSAAIIRGVRPPRPTRVPNKLATLLERCWETLPRRRPSALEVFEILREVESELQAAATDPNETLKDVVSELPYEAMKIFDEQADKIARMEEELKATKEKLIRTTAEAAELRAHIERLKITSVDVAAAAAAAHSAAAAPSTPPATSSSGLGVPKKGISVVAAAAAAGAKKIPSPTKAVQPLKEKPAPEGNPHNHNDNGEGIGIIPVVVVGRPAQTPKPAVKRASLSPPTLTPMQSTSSPPRLLTPIRLSTSTGSCQGKSQDTKSNKGHASKPAPEGQKTAKIKNHGTI